MEKLAVNLKDRLLKLRQTGKFFSTYKYQGKNKSYGFDSPAHHLQDTYTKDYEKFHTIIKDGVVKDSESGKYIKLNLLNAVNPFISTGDIPLHALKYAFGVKPYKGYEHVRLRPRWNKEGRTERPYSGKVYVTLHSIEDYDNEQPFNIVNMNHFGQVRLDSAKGWMILQERETTFPAYIPSDRVVSTHIAKYPSFKGPYNEIYAVKYGLDKELYESFQMAINKFPPHSNQLEAVKILLGEYLCHYHQFRLIDIASYEASKRNAVLVYVDEFGKLSLNLLKLPVNKGKDLDNLHDMRLKRHHIEIEENDSENNEEENLEGAAKLPRYQ